MEKKEKDRAVPIIGTVGRTEIVLVKYAEAKK